MAIKLFNNGTWINAPQWHDVEQALLTIKQDDATIYLENNPIPSSGVEELTITSSDDGYYYMMLGVEDELGPRVYRNPNPEDKMIYIGGYSEHDSVLTKDFDLVCRAVKEFFETGDVSKDILS